MLTPKTIKKLNSMFRMEIVFLTAWAVVVIFPLYWMFVTALLPPAISMSWPPKLLPIPFTFLNFQRLFAHTMVFRWTLNSIIQTFGTTVLCVFLATQAGYVLAKHKFPGNNIIFWLIMSMMMIPWHLRLLPMFIIITKLGWVDSFLALIIPRVITPQGIFLMRQSLQTLPTELMDAARIDGCGEFTLFRKIIIPIAKPGMTVLGIFTFMESWNAFIWPLVVTSSAKMRTLQVGLSTIQEGMHSYIDYGLLMSGAAYSVLPMLIFFFSLQKYFTRGITVGAVKG